MTRTALTILAATIATMSARADITVTPVPYKHADLELEGLLAAPKDAAGKLPAVLIVHEWWGRNDFARRKAEQLAAMGYVAFAVDMFGKGVVTDDPAKARQCTSIFRDNAELIRARAKAGLDALCADPRVDPTHVAAIGFCFGGTTVLQMALGGLNVVGVVSFHGGLPTPVETDLPKIKARILVLHGAEDTLIPDETVKAFVDAMKKSGCDWQMISYGRAKHSFTNRGADKLNMPGVGYDAATDRRSWEAMKAFFAELIPLR